MPCATHILDNSRAWQYYKKCKKLRGFEVDFCTYSHKAGGDYNIGRRGNYE